MSQMLVLPCTKRKRPSVASHLVFRTMSSGSTDSVATRWLTRISEAQDLVPCTRLYAGSGWHHSLEALQHARQLGDSMLYAMSAGLGLVGSDDLVPPYSATFAPDPDQVARALQESVSVTARHGLWWRVLNGRRTGAEHPITARAQRYEVCVCGLGADYLAAAAADLEQAALALGPDRLFVVCVGARRMAVSIDLQRCLLPLDLRIECVLPGVRSTLNARSVAWLLRDVVPDTGWSRGTITRRVEELMGSCNSAWANRDRRRCAYDAEVFSWIRQQLLVSPATSRSVLLRQLRASGTACSQNRFARVFETLHSAMSSGGLA